MSTVAMSACWPLQINPTAKAVLISLADNANDRGVCWPSVATIAERTCFGRTAVMDAITELERLGLLSARRRGGAHNVYRVELAAVREMVANQSASRTSPAPGPVRLADFEEQNQYASRTGPVRLADPNRHEPSIKMKQPSLGRTDEPAMASPNPPPDPEPTASSSPQPRSGERKRRCRLPDAFSPTPAHAALAEELGVVLDDELAKFRDHHQARGSTMLDWDAALRTWLRNARGFDRRRGKPMFEVVNGVRMSPAGAETARNLQSLLAEYDRVG